MKCELCKRTGPDDLDLREIYLHRPLNEHHPYAYLNESGNFLACVYCRDSFIIGFFRYTKNQNEKNIKLDKAIANCYVYNVDGYWRCKGKRPHTHYSLFEIKVKSAKGAVAAARAACQALGYTIRWDDIDFVTTVEQIDRGDFDSV